MEILVILGFLLMLGAWLAMFLRMRRDRPGDRLSKYGSYVGRTRSGLAGALGPKKLSGFTLARSYWQRYGADAWVWTFTGGAALVLVAAAVSYF
jgi:hypothetical protein